MNAFAACLRYLLSGALIIAPAASAAEDTGARLIESYRPRYPAEAFYLGITGTTVVVMQVGLDGAVERVFVEQTSRNRLLDAAAIDAVKAWRFSPATEGGAAVRSRFRVPVSFALESDVSEDAAMQGRALSLPKRLQMTSAPMELDADGTVPGYIEDPLPLDIDSVAAAIALLEAHRARRIPVVLSPGVAIYSLDDKNDRTRWLVYEGGHYYAPSLVRKRLTHDGRHAYLVTHVRCESRNADACARLEGTVQRAYWQRAVPLDPVVENAGSSGSAR